MENNCVLINEPIDLFYLSDDNLFCKHIKCNCRTNGYRRHSLRTVIECDMEDANEFLDLLCEKYQIDFDELLTSYYSKILDRKIITMIEKALNLLKDIQF